MSVTSDKNKLIHKYERILNIVFNPHTSILNTLKHFFWMPFLNTEKVLLSLAFYHIQKLVSLRRYGKMSLLYKIHFYSIMIICMY